MKVSIKDLSVDMALKNTGMELEIRDTKDVFLGDLVATGSHLIWCNGRTKRENGEKITWNDFIAFMNDRTAEKKAKPVKKAAVPKKAALAKAGSTTKVVKSNT
ncbi:hypothetical protein [Massilia pseudoviolaceinigra]|uniref:hypothetical protein n=1 Tax=Massilia pseudoviolaceinigra TaxID=3057165 RepID=UPI002796B8BB|nr:hypothetical protein [Massilia sp. CCM 9206]MDQ1921697.1 hypothetical protein [Massilia sp. CCM 9206]